MTPHHLSVHRFDYVGNGECAGFFGEDRMKNNLQQQIAQFRGKMLGVARFHGVENFVGFFDQKFTQGLMGLLTVPGTTARPTQTSL